MNFSIYPLIVTIFLIFHLARGVIKNDQPGEPQRVSHSSETFNNHYALPLLHSQNHAFMLSSPSIASDYACPLDDETEEMKIALLKLPTAQCIFPNEKKLCDREFKPRLVEVDKCPDSGTLYSFRYDLCYKNIPWAMDKSYNGEKEIILQPIPIYSFCYDESTHNTLFTMHSILSELPLEEPSLQDSTRSPSNDNTDKGFFKPQFLVPYMDMDPIYARNVTLDHLNKKPQYTRLHHHWDSINYTVWQHLHRTKLFQNATIFTTAQPLKWVKLIRNHDDKAIVIVLYNIIETFSLTDENLLCTKSICNDTNWTDIELDDTDNNVHVQCCEATDEVLEILKLTEAVKPITGIFTL